MSITTPIITDATGKNIVSAINKQTAILEVMASDAMTALTSNLHEIQKIVKDGLAQEVFSIGDQIVVKWTDQDNSKEYHGTDTKSRIPGFNEPNNTVMMRSAFEPVLL